MGTFNAFLECGFFDSKHIYFLIKPCNYEQNMGMCLFYQDRFVISLGHLTIGNQLLCNSLICQENAAIGNQQRPLCKAEGVNSPIVTVSMTSY